MRFVIFHGSFGSPQGNWFPYLKEELEILSQSVLIPKFPIEEWNEMSALGRTYIPKKQNLENWLKTFEKEVYPKIKNEKELVFIGHSIGPIFIIHLLNNFNINLNSAIFVSPFFDIPKSKEWQIDLVNKSFYKTDFDFKKLRNLIPVSYVVYGDDDPYVESALTLDFGKKLGSNMIVVKGGKHLNSEFGFTKFPLILELCKTRLESKSYL